MQRSWEVSCEAKKEKLRTYVEDTGPLDASRLVATVFTKGQRSSPQRPRRGPSELAKLMVKEKVQTMSHKTKLETKKWAQVYAHFFALSKILWKGPFGVKIQIRGELAKLITLKQAYTTLVYLAGKSRTEYFCSRFSGATLPRTGLCLFFVFQLRGCSIVTVPGATHKIGHIPMPIFFVGRRPTKKIIVDRSQVLWQYIPIFFPYQLR